MCDETNKNIKFRIKTENKINTRVPTTTTTTNVIFIVTLYTQEHIIRALSVTTQRETHSF